MSLEDPGKFAVAEAFEVKAIWAGFYGRLPT
jgi:hypothetical protein